MNHQVIILRGAPGSGKSTFANKIKQNFPEMNYRICEADQYFMVDGEYVFDSRQLGSAHRQCFYSFLGGLVARQGVIVSNTNTRLSEIDPYFEVAKEFGVVPYVFTMKTQYESIHGVPQDKVVEMKNRIDSNWDLSSLYQKYFPEPEISGSYTDFVGFVVSE